MRHILALPLAGIVTLTLALGSARPAFASDGAKTDSALEKSSALYQKARGLQEHGQWVEAEKLYQEAWDLRPTFDIAGNLGDCELHVGQRREAQEHLAYALKNLPAGWTPEQKAALTARLEEARAKSVELEVVSDVEGLEVYVNGHAVTFSERKTIYVEPGDTVEGRHSGYTPDTKAVDATVLAGKRISLAPKSMERSKVPGIVVGATGAVGLGVGVALMVIAGSKGTSADGLLSQVQTREGTGYVCPTAKECAEIKGLRATHDKDINAGRALVGVGSAALVLGVAYLFLPQSRPENTDKVRVTPMASTTGGGVWLTGAF